MSASEEKRELVNHLTREAERYMVERAKVVCSVLVHVRSVLTSLGVEVDERDWDEYERMPAHFFAEAVDEFIYYYRLLRGVRDRLDKEADYDSRESYGGSEGDE